MTDDEKYQLAALMIDTPIERYKGDMNELMFNFESIFNITFEDFCHIAEKLIDFTPTVISFWTYDQNYAKGFVDHDGNFVVKKEVKNGK